MYLSALVGVVVALAAFALFLAPFSVTGFAVFAITDQSAFDQGSYENTSYNGSAVTLVGENLTGTYISPVFNAGNRSHWTTFSWIASGSSPLVFVKSCSIVDCSDTYWNELLVSSPSSLHVPNATYFQYKLEFVRTSVSDSVGVQNVTIDYDLVPYALSVRVLEPRPGAFYGYNGTFSLNFTVNGTHQACWYTLNGGSAVALPGCDNTTLELTGGNYLVRVFANDSNGVVANRSSNFTIGEEFPTVYLIDPPSGYSTNQTNQAFTYYVNDSDLTTCNLLTDFAGSWSTSATNTTQIIVGDLNSFNSAAVSNGNFLWGVECFDAQTNNARTGSRFITVDTLLPSVTLTGPIGVIASKNNIALSLSVNDLSATTCIYSVTKIGQGTLLVIVMPQCVGTSFNVASDGEYRLDVLATDISGNAASTSSSFIVSSNGNSGGPGSGGGGISVNPTTIADLSYGVLPAFNLRPGFSENASMDVFNSGNLYLNNCSVRASEGGWITGDGVFSLSPQQHQMIPFAVNVPRGSVAGSYAPSLTIGCAEYSEPLAVPVTVLPADFEFTFLHAERQGTVLNVSYTLRDLTGQAQTLDLSYALYTESGQITVDGSTSVSVAANAEVSKSLVFELPKDSFGSFDLVLNLETNNDALTHRASIFIPLSTVSGLAVSDDNRRTLTIVGLVVLIGGCLAFVLRFAYARWKRIRSIVPASPSPVSAA